MNDIERVIAYKRRRNFVLITTGLILWFVFVNPWVYSCIPNTPFWGSGDITDKVFAMIMFNILSGMGFAVIYGISREIPNWKYTFLLWWNGK